MARPFTASDEQILEVASSVMSRRGPDLFSIAEVASEVGVSRAAIIQRFKSTSALRTTSLTHLVDLFTSALDKLLTTFAKSAGGDNLLRLGAFIGSYVHTRESSAKFFASYTTNIQDLELAELELRRGSALRTAISRAMPKVVVEHEVAVSAFGAHLTGNILAWLAMNDSNPRRHLVTRTSEWLRFTRIPFSEDLLKELLGPASAAPSDRPVRIKARNSKKKNATGLAASRSKTTGVDR